MGKSRKVIYSYDLFHVIHVAMEIMLPRLDNIPEFMAC